MSVETLPPLAALARAGRTGYSGRQRGTGFQLKPRGRTVLQCGERCGRLRGIDWDYAAWLLRVESMSAALEHGLQPCALLHPLA